MASFYLFAGTRTGWVLGRGMVSKIPKQVGTPVSPWKEPQPNIPSFFNEERG